MHFVRHEKWQSPRYAFARACLRNCCPHLRSTFAYIMSHQTLGAPSPPYWFCAIQLQLLLQMNRVHMFSFRNSSSVSQSEKVSKYKKVRGDRPAFAHAENNTDDITADWWNSIVCVRLVGSWGSVFLCSSACTVGVLHACVPATIIGDPFNHESWD